MSVQWFSKRNERTTFDLFLNDQRQVGKIIATLCPAVNNVKGSI